ncbi:hypothetical protein [Streptomyces sp. NPDC006307]|uniref:hypothetical protein n=1 Tax=Streptomyces sp. NPDC006307 TaxID=3156748 RepID=UPI0033BCF9EB
MAVLIADGGQAISDLAVLRDQPDVFGPVASTPTAWRLLAGMALGPGRCTGGRLAAGRRDHGLQPCRPRPWV